MNQSWLNCCKEATTEEQQQEEEKGLGQEKQGMEIGPVEIRTSGVQDFWLHLLGLCRTQGEQMVSTCVVPTVKHGGGGVMV